MKIEKFSDNSKKVKIAFIIGFILCAIIMIIINIFTSKAKYQNTQSVKIVEGKVNYILPDLNVVAAYKKENGENKKIEEIPKSGYVLSSDSYCTVPDSEDQIKEDITYKDGKVYIGINKKGTKCYLYFEEKQYTGQDLLADVIKKSKGNKDSFTSVATTDEGIYSVADPMYGGTSYYWRGAVTDNYVHFADAYWRIIRINGDGSIRIIYAGTTAHPNGECEECSLGKKKFNSSTDKAEYVGLKYTEGNAHGYGTASTILGSNNDVTSLYGWYKANIIDKNLNDIVDQGGMFCGDRIGSTVSSSKWESIKDEEKTGKIEQSYYYGANFRVADEKKPTLECRNENDIYGTKSAMKGNKSLIYPVGLITADEVMYAGGDYYKGNKNYYLYTGNDYWTMSPFIIERGVASEFFVYWSDGTLASNGVSSDKYVRPVINLKADTTFSSGNGSYDSPFEVH